MEIFFCLDSVQSRKSRIVFECAYMVTFFSFSIMRLYSPISPFLVCLLLFIYFVIICEYSKMLEIYHRCHTLLEKHCCLLSSDHQRYLQTLQLFLLSNKGICVGKV